MNDIIELTEMKMQEAIENMDARLVNIRAGRANPAILDKVLVSYYGVPTQLKQLANISIPEARQLFIKPFDKSCIGAIEKGIYEAKIGLTPNNNGEAIILNIPVLTEDTRREYVKQAKKYAEDAKIALRNIRQDANNEIKKSDENDDDKKSFEKNIQDLIGDYNKKIEIKLNKKDEELMKV
jgi:ribosome recycling factor